MTTRDRNSSSSSSDNSVLPASPRARLLGHPSAGDLLIAAADRWDRHANHCDLDPCEMCDVVVNQFRLALKVFQNSAHRQATAAQVQEDWHQRYVVESRIVDEVWAALGISTYEQAQGKHIATLVAELRARVESPDARLLALVEHWRLEIESDQGLTWTRDCEIRNNVLAKCADEVAAVLQPQEHQEDWQRRYLTASLIVDEVWAALGISTVEQAQGKHVATLVAELRKELAAALRRLPPQLEEEEDAKS